MSPNIQDSVVPEEQHTPSKRKFETFDRMNPLLGPTVIFFHLLAVYGCLVVLMGYVSWKIIVYQFVVSFFSGFGIVAGAHRLWAHRSYKAKLPLRIFLMVCNTLTLQGPIYCWTRWHRLHHKHSDTDADPHNANRGLFYAQVGWLILYDHQKFLRNSKGEIETADLEADPVVMWQNKHYDWFCVLGVVVTCLIPWSLGWGDLFHIFLIDTIGVLTVINITNTVNSLAHLYGYKPYDKSILPAQNWIVGWLALGEGWHNYHHAFPWDYRTSEHGFRYDFTQGLIEFFAWLGLAYDLRTASEYVVKARAARTGDGSLTKVAESFFTSSIVESKAELRKAQAKGAVL